MIHKLSCFDCVVEWLKHLSWASSEHRFDSWPIHMHALSKICDESFSQRTTNCASLCPFSKSYVCLKANNWRERTGTTAWGKKACVGKEGMLWLKKKNPKHNIITTKLYFILCINSNTYYNKQRLIITLFKDRNQKKLFAYICTYTEDVLVSPTFINLKLLFYINVCGEMWN